MKIADDMKYMPTAPKKTLVVVISSTAGAFYTFLYLKPKYIDHSNKGRHITWNNFNQHLLNFTGADLALSVVIL